MDLKNIPPVSHWLIFTDLDGTLLDHHNYSHEKVRPSLDKLKRRGVPVIINSSKTIAEIEHIANELELTTPQIAENGSIIFAPEDSITHHLGAKYSDICNFIDQLRSNRGFKFTGFHDWSADEISLHTGLDLEAAIRASQRAGSEPLLWEDTEDRIELFRKLLHEEGLELKRGGRFWHVMGQTDKVKAMHVLVERYRKEKSLKPFVIALGDSANDQDMLANADIAVKVFNPDGTQFALPDTNKDFHLINTTLAGPSGWNEAMLSLLSNAI